MGRPKLDGGKKEKPRHLWKKGESGNPKGRPSIPKSLTEALRTIVDKQILAETLWEMAKGKYFPAIRYIYDRCEGYPRQSVEVNNPFVDQWMAFWKGVDAEGDIISGESEAEDDPDRVQE